MLLAYTELFFESKSETATAGRKLILEELAQLNEYVQEKMVLNEEDFLATDNFTDDSWTSSISFVKKKYTHLGKYSTELAKTNAFEYLRNSTALSKNEILFNEPVFMNAYIYDDIPQFWQYIENLFWQPNETKDDPKTKIVSVLKNKLTAFHDDLLLSLGHIMYMSQSQKFAELIGLTEDELSVMGNELGRLRNASFPFATHLKKIKHPFLLMAFRYCITIKKNGYKKQWQEHFSALMLELYEYRNAAWHSGRANEYSLIKLTALIPLIINRARWEIIDACKANPALLYPELIDLLSL